VCRSALYSPLLSPFGFESVTIFDPAPLCASPSQKPACGFPAQASSDGLSPDGIHGDDGTRPREGMPCSIAAKALPREAAPLTPAIEPLEQAVLHRLFKAVQGAAVVGHPKVVEVATHLARQGLPEVGELPGIVLLA
jgi:hypothetical protein